MKPDSECMRINEYILFNLREALSSLTETIKNIENNREYDEAELYVEMQHIYHHLNHAWNARHVPPDKSWNADESMFAELRQFPTDIDL